MKKDQHQTSKPLAKNSGLTERTPRNSRKMVAALVLTNSKPLKNGKTTTSETIESVALKKAQKFGIALSQGQDFTAAFVELFSLGVEEILQSNIAKAKNQKPSTVLFSPDVYGDITAKFIPFHGVEHKESLVYARRESTNGGTYELLMKKLGQTELFREQVSAWLSEDEAAVSRPPLYADRQADDDGKRDTVEEFFARHYGEINEADAINSKQLNALDPMLYNNLAAKSRRISSVLPTQLGQVEVRRVN